MKAIWTIQFSHSVEALNVERALNSLGFTEFRLVQTFPIPFQKIASLLSFLGLTNGAENAAAAIEFA